MRIITKSAVVLAVGLMLAGAISASAEPRGGRFFFSPQVHVYRPFVYDPYWGPWYPYGYWYSAPISGPQASIRTEVKPKDAEVYVDGYFAGRVDDFDGVFTHLHVVPGGHAITFHLDGFRTVTQTVYARPDSTMDLKATMEQLPAGESSAPVPAPRQGPSRQSTN